MIILRQRHFSVSDRKMIEKLIEKLEKAGIEDYEIVPRIPRNIISISIDSLGIVKVYLPLEEEYMQYDIDDFIRRNFGLHYRTLTTLDRNIYVQKVSQSLGLDNLVKLINFIIEETDFCAILE